MRAKWLSARSTPQPSRFRVTSIGHTFSIRSILIMWNQPSWKFALRILPVKWHLLWGRERPFQAVEG